MPAISENLEQSLHRALAVSSASHHEYAAIEHLLLVLIDDRRPPRSCDVDLEKLRRNLVMYIEAEPAKLATEGWENSKPSTKLQRLVQRAVAHVQSVGRVEVPVANVLVAIFAERDSRASALLEEQGMTRYDATLYIGHGIRKADRLSRGRGGAVAAAISTQASGLLAKVLLLNDDYTPVEFVVHLLEHVFDKNRETAVRTILQVQGAGICGVYPCDAADARVTEVLELAHKHQHPLRCF